MRSLSHHVCGRRSCKQSSLGVALLFLFTTLSWAQVDKGSITGTVSDSSGAVIVGVQVSARNAETGALYPSAPTNNQGIYSILNLPVGQYSVHFKKQGFKAFDQNGVTVTIAQVVKLNSVLPVGNIQETVTVTMDAPLVDTETATTGSTMTSADLTKLPLSVAGGRDIQNIALSTVPTVGSTDGTTWSTYVAGSQTQARQVMIDGTDANAGIQGEQPPPGMDAVQVFQVQTSGISAEASQTGGGSFLYELKSGTNRFHGSAYGFLHNEAFDANTWDNNYWLSYCKGGSTLSNCSDDHKRARDRFYDYGFSAGGPIWKNHTFIFGSYEVYNQTDLRQSIGAATVPTTAMLGGDFSGLLIDPQTGTPFSQLVDSSQNPVFDGAGNPVYEGSIFDPLTGNVFAGNIIPSNRISAQSQKIISLYSQDYTPINNKLFGNYDSPFNGSPIQKNYTVDLKLDHNFSDRNHFSTSYDWSRVMTTGVGDWPYVWSIGSTDGGPLSDGQLQRVINREFRVVDAHTVNPNVVNVVSLNYNEWFKADSAAHQVDNQKLGFPAFGPGVANFPRIQFNDGSIPSYNESTIGNRFAYPFIFYQWHAKDTLSWVRGRHTLKFGGEWTALGANDHPTGGILNYNYSHETGVPQAMDSDSAVGPYVGFAFANFLLGDVSSASQSQTVDGGVHGRRKMMNFFAQDDFKVSRRLTVNLGLRWDINLPYHEINGKWSEFDLQAKNAVWSSYGYNGAIAYLSSGSQSFEKSNNFHQFGPHLGAAFQINSKLVARAAWGLLYVPLGDNQWGALSYGLTGHLGYVGTSNVNNTNPTQAAFQWDSSVYPGVVVPPTRDSNANMGNPWGSGSAYVDPNNLHLGHTNSVNTGVEYAVGKNTVVDVGFVGNFGGGLHDGVPTETNGWGGYLAVAGLEKYPQVSAYGPIFFSGSPLGKSSYKALVTEVKKRAGNGLVMDLSYTYSQFTGNVQDQSNMQEAWSLSSPFQDPYSYASMGGTIMPQDMRHQLKGYVVYDLPFGHGRKWLSGPNKLNYLVGGWTLATTLNYHSGLPLGAVRPGFGYTGWSQVFANFNGNASSLKNTFKSLDLAAISNGVSCASCQVFDPSAFSAPVHGELGNQLPNWSAFRGWANYSESLSIVKSFGFGSDGRYKMTLRGEFFNVFNRHYWSNPDTGAITDANFGQVTGVNGNRTGQVGARFEW